ncbi:MAG: DUF4936 family protein [Telluria sp.]
MSDLYVYYKVRDEDANALELNLRIMQAELGAATGVYGDLKRRPGSSDGVQTWMEVYNGADEAFVPALAAALDEAGVAGLIQGERHGETFIDIDPCA